MLESQMGEEYGMLVQVKSAVFFASELRKKYNFKTENVKRIFERIIMDEENHSEILATIKIFCRKKIKNC